MVNYVCNFFDVRCLSLRGLDHIHPPSPTPLKSTRDIIFTFTTTQHGRFKRVVFFSISYVIIMVIPQTCAQRQDGPLQNVKGAEYHETWTDIESFLYFLLLFIYLLFFNALITHSRRNKLVTQSFRLAARPQTISIPSATRDNEAALDVFEFCFWSRSHSPTRLRARILNPKTHQS